ncbi:MAG TPA: DUF4325 domain-containing protein [Actinomycetota bacterium]|nr:DUF4325 domain-containing protein [Actinomycetota bacterium]
MGVRTAKPRRLNRVLDWKDTRGRLISPEIINLEAYAGLIAALDRAKGPDQLMLDFSACRVAYADGMLPIIQLVTGLRELHVTIQWVPPKRTETYELFKGMHWDCFLEGDPTRGRPLPGRTRSFVPAMPFSSQSEANELCVRAVDVLVSQTRFARWLPDALYWTMWEVLENALLHACATGPSWFQAVSFYQRKQLNFVVVDGGIGILNSLRPAYPDLEKDHQAIREAVELGVTRDRKIGQGNGLGGCAKIIEANNGVFTIWSHSGSLQMDHQTKIYGPTAARHTGTIVELQFNTAREIDLPGVLKLPSFVPMAELDGLRPSGDSSTFRVVDEVDGLGSRKDGKSLRLKILNIRDAAPDLPVTIDFSDAPMISSSFADEAIGKLAAEIGKEAFFSGFRFANTSHTILALARAAIAKRLES